MTHFTQGLDVNLVQSNLSDLIPLFAASSASKAQTKHDSPEDEGSDAALTITEHVAFKSDSIFSDKSLFDDGMEESGNNVEHDSVMPTNQITEKESEDTKTRSVPSSQDSTDTGFSESQSREEIGKDGRGQGDGEGTEHNAERERKRVFKKPTHGVKSVLISTIADSESIGVLNILIKKITVSSIVIGNSLAKLLSDSFLLDSFLSNSSMSLSHSKL